MYTVQHPHIQAWGAREFIFSDLKNSESRGKQKITCTLELDEYDSMTGKSQGRQLSVQLVEQTNADSAQEQQQSLVADKTRCGLGEVESQYAKQ